MRRTFCKNIKPIGIQEAKENIAYMFRIEKHPQPFSNDNKVLLSMWVLGKQVEELCNHAENRMHTVGGEGTSLLLIGYASYVGRLGQINVSD